MPDTPRRLAAVPRVACALVALALWAPVAALAAQSSTDEVMRALEDRRANAVRSGDQRTLGDIYAPDFVGVGNDGKLIDRPQLIQTFMRGMSGQTFTTDDFRTADHGDTAVFYGRLTAKAPDGRVTFRNRFMHVFVKREGRWQCIAAQSSPIEP